MATKSANLYARIEPDVKEQAEGILAALGIPASNAINMFYKQIILQRGLPFELQAPENASGQLDRLEACIMDLDHMPKRYRQYELEPWKSRGLRVAPVDNYLVLYIPDDDTQVVTIIRVMYGGRDVDTQLNRFIKTK
mgnify:CR=1 FL=1